MTQLDLTVRLCRSLVTHRVEDSALFGRIEALTPELIVVLKRLDADGQYVLPSGFDAQSALDQPFEVKEVALPRLPKQFFAQTWEELLTHHGFHFSEPDVFYVLESNYYSKLDEGDSRARQYRDVVSLIKFLEGVADVVQLNADRRVLIFLIKEKLELRVEYGADDLCVLEGLDLFRDEFTLADQHAEQRKSIVKVVLADLLKSIPAEQRFRHLLKVFDEFVRRSKDNFQLYVAGFSFEKVREEIEANRLEYTLKLNKVFSEIQNQLLAVPAALLLTGSQLKATADSLLNNSVVLAGVFVFCWFMNMLIKNQCNSLEAIKVEISELKHQLELKDKPLVGKLMPVYAELDKRYGQQKTALRLVDVSVALVLGMCVLLFGRYASLW